MLLLNLCVICYYLLLCYSVCVPVFAVVGWNWLARLAPGALLNTGMLACFEHFTIAFQWYFTVTLHCYTLFLSLVYSILSSRVSMSAWALLVPSGLWCLWHLTIGAWTGHVFTPRRPPRDCQLSTCRKFESFYAYCSVAEPLGTLHPIYRTGVKLPSRCPILYLFNKHPYWIF